MNLMQAYERELARGRAVIYVAADEQCRICGKTDECRAGCCFDCKDFAETDMIEVWDRRNHEKRWPYAWCGQPAETSESVVNAAQRLAENLSDEATQGK